jgi:hypothetical protein
VIFGRMLTAEPEPVSTNLSGSGAACVTDDALLSAADARFVACASGLAAETVAHGIPKEVVTRTSDTATVDARRVTRERNSRATVLPTVYPWPVAPHGATAPCLRPRKSPAVPASQHESGLLTTLWTAVKHVKYTLQEGCERATFARTFAGQRT